jgi:hypothetical protein
VAEWYRWPTQFQQVELVMKQFENWWGQDSRVTLNTKTLINLFNIWTLDKIVNYVAVNYPGWTMYFDWIDHPAWQRICEIPDKFKPDLIEKLEQWNVDSQRPWHPKFNNPYQTSILKLQESNSMSWSLIKEKASTLADDRGLDLLNMLPDMKQLF